MFGALLDGKTLTRVPFIQSILEVQHSTHRNLNIGEMEKFLKQIYLNLNQRNFTLAKDACLMLGSKKSLIHDEFGKKMIDIFF